MGVRERKAREKKQRENDILEAARALFDEKGFLNTTLQDVACAAEISVGLIYRYFESKEDIFAALALKGAVNLDEEIKKILRASRRQLPARTVLFQVAKKFFEFYGPYGEYFDMLIYSYKGKKQVQIHTNTLTRLMSVTLNSLDQTKKFIETSPECRAKDEDKALRVVFLLWGVLLGCHKLFDATGRGHIFTLGKSRDEFLKEIVDEIFEGIGAEQKPASSESLPKRKREKRALSKQEITHETHL